MAICLRQPSRTLTRCLVCGFAEVRTDSVVDRGVVLLAECGRCEHRWTSSLPDAGGGVAGRASAVVVRSASPLPNAA